MGKKFQKESQKESQPVSETTGGKEEGLVVEGIVVEAVKGSFRVEMVDDGMQPNPKKQGLILMAHLAGKLRKNNIKIVQGDRVQVEVSPYDLSRGRIIYRMKY